MQSQLKAAGIDEVIVFAVNDPHVMSAWAKDQGVNGTMIRFLADPEAKLTTALGMLLDDQRVLSNNLGNPRCKRFALLVDDGTIRAVKVSGTPDDPAGDDDPSETNVESMLACCVPPKAHAPVNKALQMTTSMEAVVATTASTLEPRRFFIESQPETCLQDGVLMKQETCPIEEHPSC